MIWLRVVMSQRPKMAATTITKSIRRLPFGTPLAREKLWVN
jgi:hypothetical protein